MPIQERLTASTRVRRFVRTWIPAAPRFSVSIDLTEGPDLLCTLSIHNPGPGFLIQRARLISPRHGLIYQRESFLSDPILPRGFNEWVINQEIRAAQDLRLPFELWIPSWDPRQTIEIAVKTSRRRRSYRCRPQHLRRRAES